jgi:prolyl-tRNA synthetase
MGETRTAITPTRAEDFPEWFQQVIRAADLAENSPVRGCMVIKPWGYAIWERVQEELDRRIKATGHVNAYFPLFIPMSYLEAEAAHVEGFAKECAVVTHHRLEHGPEGKLVPAGELEEPLVVRPTSETIIGAMFSKWVQSYRDLPLLINQWANVVRWELRPRLFLRTTEFLWQEGHTAHATREEAEEETRRMLDVYAEVAREVLAIPVVEGEKTAEERFPGAVATYSIEAMMQDGKALQCGTSHFLGQNFARAQNIRFLTAAGEQEHAWTTSWGVSTRLVGALIMAHGDDDGLALPPRVAPLQVAIVPIFRDDGERAAVLDYCDRLAAELGAVSFGERPVRAGVDRRDERSIDKVWRYVKQGVPIRLEIGPRDVAAGAVFMGRRDRAPKEKKSVPRDEFVATVGDLLAEVQQGLYARAEAFRAEHTATAASAEEFEALFRDEGAAAGFILAHAVEDGAYQERIKELKVSARCAPLADNDERGPCIFTGRPGCRKVIFARAY